MATIQLASRDTATVFQVVKMLEFPTVLRDILQSNSILKVCQGIESSDTSKLRSQNITLENYTDLQRLAKEFGFDKVNLQSVSGHVLGKILPKDKRIQMSDWSSRLNEAQLSYAATDAWITLHLYQILKELKRKNSAEGNFENLSLSQFRKQYCFLCDVPFKSESELFSHKSTVHSNLHQCDVCGIIFPGKQPLVLHKNKHVFKCNDCAQVFSEQQDLLNHTKDFSHQPKILNCEVCNKISNSEERLLWHFQTYHPRIPFPGFRQTNYGEAQLVKKEVGVEVVVNRFVNDSQK